MACGLTLTKQVRNNFSNSNNYCSCSDRRSIWTLYYMNICHFENHFLIIHSSTILSVWWVGWKERRRRVRLQPVVFRQSLGPLCAWLKILFDFLMSQSGCSNFQFCSHVELNNNITSMSSKIRQSSFIVAYILVHLYNTIGLRTHAKKSKRVKWI